ncbi:MAG: hypothetical protein HRU25_16635 [Psychrobium sp.]|nr:hypothetical protein [Psychrobium sp.]
MGGDDKVEETAYEKELAKVYLEQWGYYKSNIVPVENQVIEEAKASNDASVYQGISDDTNLGYQRSFAQAGDSTTKQLTANGVNPNSGKFKGAINSLSDIEGSVSADAKSRSQIAGQERHIDKMSNVMAMGQGEAQQAVSSLNDIAVNSQRKAINDASISSQKSANTLSAVGALGGAYASHYLNNKKPELASDDD